VTTAPIYAEVNGIGLAALPLLVEAVAETRRRVASARNRPDRKWQSLCGPI
jgi:hypothetical protein